MKFIGPDEFGVDLFHFDKGDKLANGFAALLGLDLDMMIGMGVIDIFLILLGAVFEEIEE